MALQASTTLELDSRESVLIKRLCALYEEEIQVYGRVLQLSRQQGNLIRQGTPLGQIRNLLEQKMECLNLIGRLEATERQSRDEWDRGKSQWSSSGRSQIHGILGQVGTLIEQILICEEENDLQLIQQTEAC